ncbi:ABC transporter ATP-binding protein, partial [Streptomyces sp. NPDC002067]
RALAADPPVLLMDEPFGAVDPVVREHLQNEFRRLQRQLGKTVLFVTHDIEEAIRLGDRIAVYGHGRIEQFDTPAAVLGAPATPYVAEFVGADRGIKRLSVTPVEAGDLEERPVVQLDDPAGRAAAALAADDASWAVVLDGDAAPYGWVPAAALTGDGPDGPADPGSTVRDHARPMDATLPVGAPLREAFGALLGHDAGWIAVLDEGRYAGILTPGGLHAALRRATTADTDRTTREAVTLDTVPSA